MNYTTKQSQLGVKLLCPVPNCSDILFSPNTHRQHFCNIFPQDYIRIQLKGKFLKCKICHMVCNPAYPVHINTTIFKVGSARSTEKEMATASSLATRLLFHVSNNKLE